MKNDVFISYSTTDKHVADAVCSTFENSGIRCWIAPRDILPGSEWAQSITDAIKSSKIMVLVFSKNSNDSPQVSKELNLAVGNKLMVIPFKIDDCTPSGNMEYFLADTHWLDAIDGDMQSQINKLKDVVASVLPHSIKETEATTLTEPQEESPVTEKIQTAEEKQAVNETEEPSSVKKDEPLPEVKETKKKDRLGFFTAYKNLWKKCFIFRGSTGISELLKAELVHILIIELLSLLANLTNETIIVELVLLYCYIGAIPFISMLARSVHGVKKGRISHLLKVELSFMLLGIYWIAMFFLWKEAPIFALLWLFYTILLAIPIISMIIEATGSLLTKNKK